MKHNAMGWECGMYGKNRNAYRVLVGKPEGKRASVRTRPRREGKIKMWGIS